MSDNESEDNNEDNILENEEIEDGFKIKENINEILNKNKIDIEIDNKSLINKIIELHEDLGIKDEQLIQLIEKCIINKLIDYSFIKLISDFAYKTIYHDKIVVLKEFYEFISDPEFDKKDVEKIKQKVPTILEKYDPENMDICFMDLLLKMKIEIVLEIFEINNENIKNVIITCIEKNWTVTNIKVLKSKLEILIPLDEINVIDKKEIDKVREENKKKLSIIKTLQEIISIFPVNKEILNINQINFNNIDNIAKEFYIKFSTYSQISENEPDIYDLLYSLENDNLNYFSKEKIEQFILHINLAKNIEKPIDIKKWIIEFKKYNFKSNDKYKYTAKSIGVISFALEKIKNFSLRESQMLAIFIFIDNHESQQEDEENDGIVKNNKKDNGKGIIEEIASGEGKSVIISCLAIYFGLRNHNVDIITSSLPLAIRDSNEFNDLYNIFGLSDDYVKDNQPECYKADILYGSFLDFEGNIFNELFHKKEIIGRRKKDIIIIDDIDNVFIDCIEEREQFIHSSNKSSMFLHLYLLANLKYGFINDYCIKEILKKYKKIFFNPKTDECDGNKLYEFAISTTKQYNKIMLREGENSNNNKEYKNKTNIFDQLERYKEDINKIIKNIENNVSLDYSKKYQIKFKKQEESGQLKKNKAINDKISFENKRKERAKTLIQNEIDEFKHKIYENNLNKNMENERNSEIDSDSPDFIFLSHITYFIKFKKKNFFGLTGTLGEIEIQNIYKKELLNSNLVFIPSYIKIKRFIELPPIICAENNNNHINKICDEIYFHFIKGRKILVICKNINEAINIENKLLQNEYTDKVPTISKSIFLYDENNNRNLKEELGLIGKRIILTTYYDIRGNNIDISETQEKNGGLHVIITKLLNNSRNQKQAFYMTSRNGKKGSGQIIISEETNFTTYEKLINERDRKEKEFLIKIYLFLNDKTLHKYIECIRNFPEYNIMKENEE